VDEFDPFPTMDPILAVGGRRTTGPEIAYAILVPNASSNGAGDAVTELVPTVSKAGSHFFVVQGSQGMLATTSYLLVLEIFCDAALLTLRSVSSSPVVAQLWKRIHKGEDPVLGVSGGMLTPCRGSCWICTELDTLR